MLSEGEREKERGDFFKRKNLYNLYCSIIDIYILRVMGDVGIGMNWIK